MDTYWWFGLADSTRAGISYVIELFDTYQKLYNGRTLLETTIYYLEEYNLEIIVLNYVDWMGKAHYIVIKQDIGKKLWYFHLSNHYD